MPEDPFNLLRILSLLFSDPSHFLERTTTYLPTTLPTYTRETRNGALSNEKKRALSIKGRYEVETPIASCAWESEIIKKASLLVFLFNSARTLKKTRGRSFIIITLRKVLLKFKHCVHEKVKVVLE